MKEIKKQLSNLCNFTSAWEKMDDKGRSTVEMGYARMDYDGHQWWRTFHRVNEALEDSKRIAELESVCDALTNAFPNLSALEKFARDYAERLNEHEFNLYLNGKECNFWIRVITTRRDYNLYIHAICITKRKDES